MTDYHFKKFLDQVTPLENFDDEIPPEAPNYADLVYWAATPDQEAQQFFIPDDSFKVNKKGNPVEEIKLLYLMNLATYMLQNIDKRLTFLFLIKIRME